MKRGEVLVLFYFIQNIYFENDIVKNFGRMKQKMWIKIKHQIYQWFSNSYQSVSTKIKEVQRINTESKRQKNRQGHILISVPFGLSRTSSFKFLSNLVPSLFSYIASDVLHSVHKIREMEESLMNTEIEKENFKNEIELLSKKLEDTIAEIKDLEKKYEEMADQIEKQRASRKEIIARKCVETFNIFIPSSYYMVWGAILINIIMCGTVFISIMSYLYDFDLEMIQKHINELLTPVPVHASFMTTVCISLIFW